MRTKGKAHIGAATLTWAEEKTEHIVSFPFVDSSIDNDRKQGEIEKILPIGKENAISTPDLVRLIGVGNSRTLQAMIERERNDGALILSSSSGGYYLPASGAQGRQEINAFYRTVYARAVHSLRTLKTARRALRELDGQQEMEG